MNKSSPKILVVDDEPGIRELLSIMLSSEGYDVSTARDYNTALTKFQQNDFDIIIADIMMPGKSGIDLMKAIREKDPDIPIIIITAYASINSAIEALRLDAFDYITKPFSVDQIKFIIKRALDVRKLKVENRLLKQKLTKTEAIDGFIGTSKSAQKIRELVKKIAQTESTVLITGESGTGKEIIARAIHELSPRSGGPFVSINCAAVPETLLESELFGYKKGAFTGATKDKIGLFAAADGGTFFLDEVAEMPLPIQAKLLRILETYEFVPLGSTTPVKVDIRLVAATNKNLKELVDQNRFRADLYYRLNVIHIHIPPLRERREDILPIAYSILERVALKRNEPIKKLSDEAKELILNAPWEGNVRELENVLERAAILCDDEIITPEHLPEYIVEEVSAQGQKPFEAIFENVDDIKSLEEMEKAYIFYTLARTNWNKALAAEKLGIDLSTLYRKIDRYGIRDLIPQKRASD
ncbi:sigma-54-dependent Fis family transcriptional regulator [bacterium]|nr:sigma-54-dependent Fis family transcriptional regulator [bacterium]